MFVVSTTGITTATTWTTTTPTPMTTTITKTILLGCDSIEINLQGVSKRSSDSFSVHSSVSEASKNKVFQQLVDKYTKASCLDKKWSRYLQNCADCGNIRKSRMLGFNDI